MTANGHDVAELSEIYKIVIDLLLFLSQILSIIINIVNTAAKNFLNKLFTSNLTRCDKLLLK